MAGASFLVRSFTFGLWHEAARGPNSGEFSPRWLGSHLASGAWELARKALSFWPLRLQPWQTNLLQRRLDFLQSAMRTSPKLAQFQKDRVMVGNVRGFKDFCDAKAGRTLSNWQLALQKKRTSSRRSLTLLFATRTEAWTWQPLREIDARSRCMGKDLRRGPEGR